MSPLRKPTLVFAGAPYESAQRGSVDAYDRLEDLRKQYLHDWTIVKRARFNAAKRYERKQQASNLAFATFAVFGFMLPYFILTFGSLLSEETKKLLDFVGYSTGLFAMVLGLVEQARGYEAISRRINKSALEVNSVLRKLRAAQALNHETLGGMVADYEAALERCDVNHDDIDSEIAVAQQRHHENRRAERPTPPGPLKRLKWQEFFHIWGLYMCILPMPTVLAIFVRIAL